jgi:hypothetical protein
MIIADLKGEPATPEGWTVPEWMPEHFMTWKRFG